MKRILPIFLAFLLLLLTATTSFAATNATKDDEYYIERTHAYGLAALDNISNEAVKTNIKNTLIENDLTLLSVNTASIYFEIERLADGSIAKRPMSVAEVLLYQHSLNASETSRAIVNPVPDDYGKLTITLTASADARHQVWLLARADWEFSESSIGNLDEQQAAYDDKCELTWGGDGALRATNRSVSGRYYNNTAISFFEYRSNRSVGYGWSFAELASDGTTSYHTPAEYITPSVTLAPISAYQGRSTTGTFKYIHTYPKIGGGIGEKALDITAEGLPY